LEKHLHIIAITVPYPPNFGGVIDLYWKLEALYLQKVKIHLHCFLYDREPAVELEKFCTEVKYYKRNLSLSQLASKIPFIVQSRKNEQLFNNLLKDDYPILVEGIHCSYILTDRRFQNRKIILRSHNVEYEYYQHLADSAVNVAKKIYSNRESKKLYWYEKNIASKNIPILTVTSRDAQTYTNTLGAKQAAYLPLFLPTTWKITSLTGMGTYCLYHGDLSISSNQKAVKWLLQKVFALTNIPLVIAGKNPPKGLVKLAHKLPHTCIVANPGDKEMSDLISKAQLHILPSYNSAGIKLKLLNALYNGRFCLANNDTLEGSSVESLCIKFNNVAECVMQVEKYFQVPFDECEIEKRKALLQSIFNNESNAQKIIALM
jgi:glycosyltransferase involved in cell wall biosynthesis